MTTSSHVRTENKEDTVVLRNETPDNDNDNGDLSGEAAGVVRGVSRTVGKSGSSVFVRSTPIGRLPVGSSSRSLFKQPTTRLPVRQVARVSDRVSTGMDWWASATEGGAPLTTKKSKKLSATTEYWNRARGVTFALVKNTLLGMAVFESYGYLVGQLAPPPPAHESNDNALNDSTCTDSAVVGRAPVGAPELDKQGGDTESFLDNHRHKEDEYDRASVAAHLVAGGVAGSIHGLASSAATLLERVQLSKPPPNQTPASSLSQFITKSAAHHSIAHAMLFGTYEGVKRQLLRREDERTTYDDGPVFLMIVGLAGGVAGQVQHIASHYLEHSLGETALEGSIMPPPQHIKRPTTRTTSRRHFTTSTTSNNTKPNKFPPLPALRPVLYAFPPSAIGFVAFEYGKRFMT